MKRLRRRLTASALRRQDDQQATVVVVGGKDVGDRLGGKVALGVDRDLLAKRANPPLQGGVDRIAVFAVLFPLQSQYLFHRPADHVLVGQTGQLEAAASGVDHPR